MKPNGKGRGGGILKGNTTNGGPREAHSAGRGVRFSANGGEDNGDRRTQSAPLRTPTINKNSNEYDSDDEEAIMASGEAFIHTSTNTGNDDSIATNDASLRTPAEIEEARRKRGRVRRHEDIADTGDFEKDDMDEDDVNDDHNQKYNNSNNNSSRSNEGLSLITNQNANPDAYESNASGNASCPVEPFNMNAEKDGGLGYFDGDTYVFRQNTKPVDGEEDAWLDGIGSDDEKEIGRGGGGGKTKGGGGLDSTSIWKPSDSKGDISTMQQKKKKKAKFVNEDAIPEDLGRRLVTLLSNDEDTVMIALAKHGATMRDLSSQETKLMKKNKLKKRGKSSKSKDGGRGESATKAAAPENDVELKTIKRKVEQTRETVEELTELADALLFDGETEAYELTRRDWIHRFKLEQYFPSLPATNSGQVKRPADGQDLSEAQAAKKKSRGYFDNDGDDAITKKGDVDTQQRQADTPSNKPQQHGVDETVMWEYKGNEDGAIHGPYTSKQMLDWTSCGYFVGANAVDIRRVQASSSVAKGGDEGKQVKKSEEEDAKNTDVDDLMADLMDDDDAGEVKKEDETTVASESAAKEALWMRSDRVDFSLYM